MSIEGISETPKEWGDAGIEAARVAGDMQRPESTGGGSGEITSPASSENQSTAGSGETVAAAPNDPGESEGRTYSDSGTFSLTDFIMRITDPEAAARRSPSEVARDQQNGPRVDLRRFIQEMTEPNNTPERPTQGQPEPPAPDAPAGER